MTPTKPESLARRGRFVRLDPAAKIRPFSTVEHGEAILCLLDDRLWLTNDQIELALFRHGSTGGGKRRAPGGSEYAANTALRRLFDLRLIDRVPAFLPGTKPDTTKQHYVNVLSGAGAKLASAVQQTRGAPHRWQRSLLPSPWRPLLHPFWVRQVGLAASAACFGRPIAFSGWLDDRQLAAGTKAGRYTFAKVPDGFFVLTNTETGKAFPQLVEVDLGSQTVVGRSRARPDWRGKIEGYLAYLASHFRQEFGLGPLPVVLTITSSQARLEHLLAATAAVGGGGRFWFTTQERLFPAPRASGTPSTRETAFWAPIWRVPQDDGLRSLADRCGVSGNTGPTAIAAADRREGETDGPP